MSSKRLHVVDRLMLIVPFVTVRDLNDACKRADTSHEARSQFLRRSLMSTAPLEVVSSMHFGRSD